MNKPIVEKIARYSHSLSRNKIVFHREPITGISSIDIGKLLSEAIFNLKDKEKLSMKASMKLDNILQSSITNHTELGDYLAITNLGILFEPEIKLNFSWVLENYSQNNLLFVQWEGEIESNNIFFLTKKEGLKINLNNLSHIVI